MIHNNYINRAFIEKPYGKPLERNVVYTSIFTLSVQLVEKPYGKPLERYAVYSSITTLLHAKSHDVKWCQNKPWFSNLIERRRRYDVVVTSLTLFRF